MPMTGSTTFAYLGRSFFKIITCKERKVYVLSKNLHQSVTSEQNESCLACKYRQRTDRNKIRSEIKFKMAAIANFVG